MWRIEHPEDWGGMTERIKTCGGLGWNDGYRYRGIGNKYIIRLVVKTENKTTLLKQHYWKLKD